MLRLLSFLPLAILCLGFGLSCQKADERRDIRDFYFPLAEMEQGKVYEFRPVAGDSLAPFSWQFRAELEGDSAILTGVQFDVEGRPVQRVREERVGNGMQLREMQLYAYDSTGRQERVEVDIEAPDVFPFSVRDSGGIFLFKVRWQPPSEPGVTYTVIKNRRYLGDTTYLFKGRSYDCVAFQVNELFEQDIEGVLEQPFSGVEFYARGIGLVYYRKDIAEGLRLEYGLADRYEMP